MDAQADGSPVTPRHGCPVELNALWYNTLAFVDYLAAKFREPTWDATQALRDLRVSFFEHFWVARGGGYLGDVWRDGFLDQSVRPNQIFAVSLPYPVLEESHQASVVECVRNKLLTPFGLRTLSPDDPAYKGRYEGGRRSATPRTTRAQSGPGCSAITATPCCAPPGTWRARPRACWKP